MSKKIALVLGITGQDGSNLAELLLKEEVEVHGVVRRSSTSNTQRIDHIFDPESKKYIHYGDLANGIDELLYQIQPDYIFNTGAMSHVRISFDIPVYTLDINTTGVARILEGIRKTGLTKKTRFLQCSSSEMFGVTPPPQREDTLFHPVSPYGVSKVASYWLTRCYRDGYGMFACNSICFNHTGPRRGINFVTRKITRLACKIKLGLIDKIELGNLEAKRDFGDSRDYVVAMWKIINHTVPDDFVIATGQAYSIRQFAEKVFDLLELDFYKYLVSNDVFKRPVEVPYLLGDPTKIKTTLNWEPKLTFDDIVRDMVDSDMKEIKKENGIN